MPLSAKALLKIQVWSRVRLSMSKVRDAEFVGAFLLAPKNLHCDSTNQISMSVECGEHSRLIPVHGGVHVFQRVFGHKERPFHGTVVTPEADRTPGCVVAAAGVWKLQSHQASCEGCATPVHETRCGRSTVRVISRC